MNTKGSLRHCLGLLQVINLLPLRCMSGSPFQCCVWYYPESNGNEAVSRIRQRITDDESTTKITQSPTCHKSREIPTVYRLQGLTVGVLTTATLCKATIWRMVSKLSEGWGGILGLIFLVQFKNLSWCFKTGCRRRNVNKEDLVAEDKPRLVSSCTGPSCR